MPTQPRCTGSRRPQIGVKRVYDRPAPGDGYRVLVERLWPRGMTKAALRIDAWATDVAPSHRLRRWFGHDPVKWLEFVRRYTAELDRNAEALAPLLATARTRPLTLLYSARDTNHNSAVVLQNYLRARLRAVSPRNVARRKRIDSPPAM